MIADANTAIRTPKKPSDGLFLAAVSGISRRQALVYFGGLPGHFAFMAMQQNNQAPNTSSDYVGEPVYDLTEEMVPPSATRTKKPAYTERARRAAIQGTVRLRCVVTSEGLPKQITVLKSLDEELDRAAVEALREWRFSPARKAGKAIAVRSVVEFEFGVL